MNTICVDSGFLIALYHESDTHHSQAKNHFTNYFDDTPHQLLVPWPILYETISTRMARTRRRMTVFNKDWEILRSQQRLVLLDDREFRHDALDECFSEVERSKEHYRPLSLADRVIRNILSKVNIKIDFITFNIGDFADVCKHRIPIVQ